MFYLYILQSLKFGSYYIGSCEDLRIRLQQHNIGKVRSTKQKLPWKLIYHESFKTRAEAQKREKQLKSWKSRAAIERLIKHL